MTSFTIPTVETENLILRAHRTEDLPAVVEFFASERAESVGGQMDEGDCWRAMLRGAGHWALRGYGLWYIQDKATGKVAGWAGVLHHIEWPEPELAWTLFEGFEGKGVAFEAATAARLYAARHFDLNALISLIAPENTRSLALAARLGATFERETVVNGYNCHLYRHPKVETA
ncbi:MAG: GNAT family N-acetyltransferase [Tateyamaria sp.]|uniref:GNAT family N-acetyltransferase n=1 Tax=Roseobacteraceae TaxID=2854170 RepID=UPI003299C6F9